MQIIGCGVRNNLRHILLFCFFTILLRIDTSFLDSFYSQQIILVYLICEFSGEFFIGLIFFLIEQIKNRKQSEKEINEKLKEVKKLQKLQGVNIKNISFIELFIIIVICILSDISKNLLSFYYLTIFKDRDLYLRTILLEINFNSLFCYILIQKNIYRHQKFSLIITSICVIFEIFNELIIYGFNLSEIKGIVICIIIHVIASIHESFEKYILEFNNYNECRLLFLEGFFGLVITFFISFVKIPFLENLQNTSKNIKNDNLTIVIILLISFLLFSGIANLYRLVTTNLFSPMFTTTGSSFCSFLFIIFSHIKWDIEEIFIPFFEIINYFCILFGIFSCFVYNEIFILYFCELEKYTHKEVANRASFDKRMNTIGSDESIESEINRASGRERARSDERERTRSDFQSVTSF